MKIDRQQIYLKCGGHCAYCGKEIDIKDMQIDHIRPKRQDGTNEIDNLNPSCRVCNHYKRAQDLEEFRDTITTLIERIKKIYIVRVGISYGIIRAFEWDKKFYFEKL